MRKQDRLDNFARFALPVLFPEPLAQPPVRHAEKIPIRRPAPMPVLLVQEAPCAAMELSARFGILEIRISLALANPTGPLWAHGSRMILQASSSWSDVRRATSWSVPKAATTFLKSCKSARNVHPLSTSSTPISTSARPVPRGLLAGGRPSTRPELLDLRG